MFALWGIFVAAGLEEAAIAGLGILIVAAMVQLGVLAGNAARQLPWPLGGIAGAVATATEAAIRLSVVWTQASANALASVIQAPWQAVWTVNRAVLVATEHLYWTADRIVHIHIPSLYAWAQASLHGVYVAAVTHSDAVSLALQGWTGHLVQQAMLRADQEFMEAVRHADQLAQAEARFTAQAVREAEQRADAEFAQATAYAQAIGRAGEAYAGDLFREALDYARAGALGAEAYAAGVGALAEDYARALTREAITHSDTAAAAVAAAAAAATAAVASRVVEIERSPCQRFCSPLGDLGSLLQELGDAGLLAVLLALFAEATEHPDQVADAIGSVIVPIARGAASDLQLGIPG
jgi:hypothetical protein